MSEASDYCDIMEYILNWLAEKLVVCLGQNQNREIQKTSIMNMRMAVSLFIKCLFSIYQTFAALSNNCIGNCEGIRWDFQLTIFAWVVYEFYIIFIEGYYIRNGENDLKFRKTWYKLIDLIQNILFFISQIIITQRNEFQTIDIIGLIFQAFDLLLNFVQYCIMPKKLLKDNQRTVDEGGLCFFLLFSIFGQLIALNLLRVYYRFYQSISSTFFDFCYVCLFIQIPFTIIEVLFSFYSKCCSDLKAKIFLSAVYGLGFGLSCFYFTPVSMLIILYIYLQRLFTCRVNYQVIPY